MYGEIDGQGIVISAIVLQTWSHSDKVVSLVNTLQSPFRTAVAYLSCLYNTIQPFVSVFITSFTCREILLCRHAVDSSCSGGVEQVAVSLLDIELCVSGNGLCADALSFHINLVSSAASLYIKNGDLQY